MTLLVLRFAFAVVLDAIAFIAWDVGTRPPLRLLRDIGVAGRRPRLLAAGLLRFALGTALLVAAGLVVRPVIPDRSTFMLLETVMLIAALVVENLLGPDVRRLLRPAA